MNSLLFNFFKFICIPNRILNTAKYRLIQLKNKGSLLESIAAVLL